MKKGIVGVLVGLALAANHASAQLLTYEGFNYAAGLTLDGSGGLSGGTGWAANWGGAGISSLSDYQITTGGLSDGALLTSSNKVSTTSPGAGFDGRYNTYPNYGAPGSTTFFSVLIQPNNLGVTNANGSGGSGGFGLQILGGGGANGILVGKNGSGPNWALEEGSTTAPSSTPVVSNQTTFLVVEADFGSSTDTFKLFVNPTPGAAEPGTPSATLSYFINTQNGIGLNTFNGAMASYDEIRIGTTFAAVTPVPEPSSFVLAAFGIASLIGYRIRRNAGR